MGQRSTHNHVYCVNPKNRPYILATLLLLHVTEIYIPGPIRKQWCYHANALPGPGTTQHSNLRWSRFRTNDASVGDYDIVRMWYGNTFHVTGFMWGESTSHRMIPLTLVQHYMFCCLLWCWPERLIKETVGLPVIWDAMTLWRHCNMINLWFDRRERYES